MQLVFVSSTNAAMCSVTSAFGVVFLAILGALFNAEVPELMDSHIAPADPHAFATVCFAAAGLYLFTFLFCFCQVRLRASSASSSPPAISSTTTSPFGSGSVGRSGSRTVIGLRGIGGGEGRRDYERLEGSDETPVEMGSRGSLYEDGLLEEPWYDPTYVPVMNRTNEWLPPYLKEHNSGRSGSIAYGESSSKPKSKRKERSKPPVQPLRQQPQSPDDAIPVPSVMDGPVFPAPTTQFSATTGFSSATTSAYPRPSASPLQNSLSIPGSSKPPTPEITSATRPPFGGGAGGIMFPSQLGVGYRSSGFGSSASGAMMDDGNSAGIASSSSKFGVRPAPNTPYAGKKQL